MMLYHTSSEIITTVKKGLFGKAVCFSSSPYFMCTNPSKAYVYSLETNGLKIIEAGHIFFDENWERAMPVVASLMERLTVNEDTARDLLDQTTDLSDLKEDTSIEGNFIENDFWLQGQRYEAATLMGYDGIEQRDEQGAMWMLSVETILSQTPVLYSEWRAI